MNRKIKALGLALVAVIAMSALVSSAAQAANGQFTAAAYSTVAKGAQEGATNFFEATDSNKTTCKTADYQATLSAASGELTVTPHYAECESATVGTTITLNGCDFRFKTSGATVGGATPGTADVVCPAGQKITIHVSTICKVHVLPQTGLTGVTFTNKGTNTITVDVDITNQIKYEDTKESIFCPFSGNSTNSNGDFVSNVTMECFADEGSEAHPTTAGAVTYKAGAKRNGDVE